MKLSGIYKIQSKLKPHKIYIGSAVYVSSRWNLHLSRLRRNIHDNKKLQNHFNKYGESDLKFILLLSCEKDELLNKEQFFIDIYNPWFNNRKITNSNLGLKFSEETKRKMKLAQQKRRKNNPVSIETKNKMSFKMKGKPSPLKGRKMPQSKIDKQIASLSYLCKPIIQLDKNGNIIKEWISISDIARNTNMLRPNILRAINYKRKTAYGFIWKHKLIA